MRSSLISAIATLSNVVLAQPIAQLTARAPPFQMTVDALDKLTKEAHDIDVLYIQKLSPDNEGSRNADIYRVTLPGAFALPCIC